MINFDEEIKKFSESLEVDQVEMEVIRDGGADMADALLALVEQNKQLELRIPRAQIMPTDPGAFV